MNYMIFVIYAAAAVIGYFAGAVPFGYIIGKCHGKDIRKEGSGNIGATNVSRVIGPWWGKFCFLLDFLKGFLPVAAAKMISDRIVEDPLTVLPLLVLASVVAGHIFTCFLGFKGGKGVATAAGGVFALAPLPLLAALVIWIVIFKISGYVSLGSIIAAALLPLLAWGNNILLQQTGFSNSFIQQLSATTLIFLAAVAVLAILKHISNIKRLIAGTENRFGKKSEEGKK